MNKKHHNKLQIFSTLCIYIMEDSSFLLNYNEKKIKIISTQTLFYLKESIRYIDNHYAENMFMLIIFI